MSRLGALLVGGLLLAGPASVVAAPKDCANSSGTEAKFYLDEFQVRDPAAGPGVRSFGGAVTKRLRQRLKSVARRIPALGIQYLECPARMPSGPAEFDHALQERLALQGVLLEVWSTVDSTETASGLPAYESEIQWALFPLCMFRELNIPNRGFFDHAVEPVAADSTNRVDGLLVSEDVLHAYATASIALADLQAGNFGSAYRLLNEVRCRLPAGDTGLGPHLASLIAKTIEKAQAAGQPLHIVAGAGTSPCSP